MLNVQDLVNFIAQGVRDGKTPLQAAKELLRLVGQVPGAQQQLDEALRRFEDATGRIRNLREPAALSTSELINWYPGPMDGDIFWPALCRYWVEKKGWDASIVDSIDQSSTKIVSRMQPALRPQIFTRGLVVGHVQSGKTANYTAVIAKAADVNYRIFIVLAGTTNPLRNQTQARLQAELCSQNPEHWNLLTSPDEDFHVGYVRNVNAWLAEGNFKLLGVVKKNAVVLRRLLKWLNAATPDVLAHHAVLIIDDEADQASVNASLDANKRTAINRLLLQILAKLPKAAYIAYTATPYANVFIDPDPGDLYPRDFIVSLPRPKDYFGPETIFGRDRLSHEDDDAPEHGLDMIRIVPDDEVACLRPKSRAKRDEFQAEMAASLEDAVRYFWLATAARAVRGDGDEYSTMLLHTTMYTDVHDQLADVVNAYIQGVKQHLADPVMHEKEMKSFKEQWETELSCGLAKKLGESEVSSAQLMLHLPDVISQTHIVTEHSRSEERLTYDETQRIQIVIGGNTLARGLTLEGLVTSFFVRSATAYDTLMQMGRWFGYRRGYADLTRMWMTRELAGWFYDLATVEEELRQDIERYQIENITPLDFGVRVRTHPDLNITSRLKMGASVAASISYNDRRVQTVVFKHRDSDWLRQNIEAAQALVSSIVSRGLKPVEKSDSSLVFYEVPVDYVLQFLRDYRFHENNYELRADLLEGYIQKQLARGELHEWRVAVRSVKKDHPVIELGGGLAVRTITRSRRNSGGEDAHIGVLMSVGDRAIDLDLTPEQLKWRDAELQKLRPSGIGLLVVYPIRADSPAPSAPADRLPLRLSLDAANHVIGAAFVFPKSEELAEQKYMTVDLSGVERDEVIWYEEERDDEHADTGGY